MRTNKKIEKWKKWLENISHEVSDLVTSRSIYYKFRQIVTDNSRINTGNHFFYWVETNYICTILMGIRRQIDNHSDAVSLKKLLSDMKDNCSLLSRELHLYNYNEQMKDLGNRTFDSLAGEAINVFPIERLEQDIQKLEDISILHKTYIDRRIAHYDKVPPIKALGTLQALYDAISNFEEILSRYSLLINARGIELLPPDEYDWKAIFRQAWISDI